MGWQVYVTMQSIPLFYAISTFIILLQVRGGIVARPSHGNFLQLFSGISLLVSFSAEALRSLYPNHSLVMTRTNPLGFPEVQAVPLEKTPLITNLLFVPVARSLGTVPGVLVDQVNFGAFQLTWKVSFWLRLIYHVYEPIRFRIMSISSTWSKWVT